MRLSGISGCVSPISINEVIGHWKRTNGLNGCGGQAAQNGSTMNVGWVNFPVRRVQSRGLLSIATRPSARTRPGPSQYLAMSVSASPPGDLAQAQAR